MLPERRRYMSNTNKAIPAASVAVALVAGIFFAGRWSVRAGLTRSPAAAREALPPTESSAPGRVATWTALLPVFPAAPPAAIESAVSNADDADAAHAASQARGQRAAFLLDKVFHLMEIQANTDPNVVPEARAQGVRSYLTGLVVGAIQADPAMRAAFSDQFTTRLCGRASLAAEQIISLAQVGLALPDVPTYEGYDCFFSRHGKEDAPLWFMLDAWQESGLDKPPALAGLAAVAKDSRTTRRFLSKDEAVARRIPAENRLEGEMTP